MRNYIYEMASLYDGAKSFYHKAVIYEDKDRILLMSYDTKILYIDRATHRVIFYNTNINDKSIYTTTTIRHIKEFLKQKYENIDYKKKDIKLMIDLQLKETKKNDR